MSLDYFPELVRVFRLVKNNFEFRRDSREQWEMPPDFYNGKQTIKDDCDGFCLACRKLLRDRDIPSRLVYCEVEERGRSYGHLAVEVDGWILDNFQDSVTPNTRIYGYQWLRISGYQPGDAWREVLNSTIY